MKKLLLFLAILLFSFPSYSQTISIIGTGVNGWPPTNGPEITLSTTDNITYTIPNLVVSSGQVKFRQDYSWSINWGASTFPSGTATQDGPNIPTVAGTYDVTFNRLNGTFTFIGTAAFPSIGIWGPAVNSQLGFGAPDVDLTTNDGITYTLSDFIYSTGNAYFRQDNASNFIWGSTSFPTGTAIQNGPTIQIPGGEWFTTFNRLTGDYSFTYPSIGILGTALPNGFGGPDTDLSTTDGFTYTISNLTMTDGEVKFRKDNLWNVNWGSPDFPNGTGTQDGPNIIVNAGTYDVTFDKSTGNYSFINSLGVSHNNIQKIKVFPNPTHSVWNVSLNNTMDKISLMDSFGKTITTYSPKSNNFVIDTTSLSEGVYFLKIESGKDFMVQKVVKN